MSLPFPSVNPELRRLARAMLSPRRALLISLITITALGLITLLAWSGAISILIAMDNNLARIYSAWVKLNGG